MSSAMVAALNGGVTLWSWASISIAEKPNQNSYVYLSWNKDVARLLLVHFRLDLEAEG